MRNLNAKVTPLVTFISILFAVAGGSHAAKASETERAESYIGKKINADSKEYNEAWAFVFSNPAGQTTSQLMYLQAVILFKDRPNSVLLLAEGHNDQYGFPDWVLVDDAVNIPKGLEFIGSPTDSPCMAKSYPRDIIFVAGKWVKKMKSGEYAGGYADQIEKAWRVDFAAKKLREIPTSGITCEDTRGFWSN